MPFDRLQRILSWLLIAATTIFLLDRLLSVFAVLASPLLLFALAWLFVLALKPLVDGLTRVELPVPVVVFDRRRNRSQLVTPVVRIPHTAAVILVYLGMLAVIVGIFVLLVPVIVPQIAGLQESLPLAANEVLEFLTNLQTRIDRLGLRVNLTNILRPETLAQQAGTLGSELVKQSFTIAGSIATLLFNLVFVLIVSFYMMLDGSRLVERGLALMPATWRDEVATFLAIVDRTFGGFLRAQLLQSLLYGLVTAALMVILGLPDVALASLIAGVCVLIPIVGGAFAVVPPIMIAIINAPDRLIWLIVGLVVIQQVLFNMVMPRLLGQIVGLPPLVVFAALLIGGTVAGGWGILFGIPLAGVLASVFQYLYDRSAIGRAAHQAAAAPVPPVEPIVTPPSATPEKPETTFSVKPK